MESSIKQEIQQALNSGKEVTIHQEPINAFGWTGSGYLIIDPDSGAGAYKIGGGVNGGGLSDNSAGVWTFLGLSAGILSTVFGTLLFVIAAAIAVMLVVDLILDYNNNCGSGAISTLIAASIALAFVGLFVGVMIAIVLTYTALLLSIPLVNIDKKFCS